MLCMHYELQQNWTRQSHMMCDLLLISSHIHQKNTARQEQHRQGKRDGNEMDILHRDSFTFTSDEIVCTCRYGEGEKDRTEYLMQHCSKDDSLID